MSSKTGITCASQLIASQPSETSVIRLFFSSHAVLGFMSNVCAAVVYAEQLVGRGYGLPLWHPEPTQNFGEVEIGDVGYISEGTFIRLFNALRPAGDPANAGGVPEGFVMLKPNTSLLFSGEQHVSPGPICTTTTTYRKIGAEVEGSR